MGSAHPEERDPASWSGESGDGRGDPTPLPDGPVQGEAVYGTEVLGSFAAESVDEDAFFGSAFEVDGDAEPTPPSTPRVQQDPTEPDNAALAATFCEVAATYLRPLQHFFAELCRGPVGTNQISLLLPPLVTVLESAQGMGLKQLADKFSSVQGYFDAIQQSGASTVEGSSREALLRVTESLADVLPEAFGTCAAGDPLDGVLLRTVLQQLPAATTHSVEQIFSAGFTSAEMLAEADADEVTAVTGLAPHLCALCVRHAGEYVAERKQRLHLSTPGEWLPVLEPKLGELERLQRAIDQCRGDTDEERRQLRRERQRAVLQMELLLAEMGRVAMLEELQRQRVERRLEKLREFVVKLRRPSREELLRRLSAGESLQHLDLRDQHLEGIRLPNADLAGSDLTGANLAGADLQGSRFIHACLREAFLQGAELGGAQLRHAHLEGADLGHARLAAADLSRASLEAANLEGADLERACLRRIGATDANLAKAQLMGADLRGADLSGVDAGGADLRGGDLGDAIVAEANFRGADLRGTNLSGCDLTTAWIEGARLEGDGCWDSKPTEADAPDASAAAGESATEALEAVAAAVGDLGTELSDQPAEAATAAGEKSKETEVPTEEAVVIEAVSQRTLEEPEPAPPAGETMLQGDGEADPVPEFDPEPIAAAEPPLEVEAAAEVEPAVDADAEMAHQEPEPVAPASEAMPPQDGEATAVSVPDPETIVVAEPPREVEAAAEVAPAVDAESEMAPLENGEAEPVPVSDPEPIAAAEVQEAFETQAEVVAAVEIVPEMAPQEPEPVPPAAEAMPLEEVEPAPVPEPVSKPAADRLPIDERPATEAPAPETHAQLETASEPDSQAGSHLGRWAWGAAAVLAIALGVARIQWTPDTTVADGSAAPMLAAPAASDTAAPVSELLEVPDPTGALGQAGVETAVAVASAEEPPAVVETTATPAPPQTRPALSAESVAEAPPEPPSKTAPADTVAAMPVVPESIAPAERAVVAPVKPSPATPEKRAKASSPAIAKAEPPKRVEEAAAKPAPVKATRNRAPAKAVSTRQAGAGPEKPALKKSPSATKVAQKSALKAAPKAAPMAAATVASKVAVEATPKAVAAVVPTKVAPAPVPVAKITTSAAPAAGPKTESVAFMDAGLEACVRAALGRSTGSLSAVAVAGLTELNCSTPDAGQVDVTRLEGIETLVGLETLDLSSNKITDIRPLAGLKRLAQLNLRANQIADIGPVSGLPSGCEIDLWQNPIADITPLLMRSKR